MNDKRARWLALYVLCLGDLMIVLDTNIVNVALPSIQSDLGFSQTALAWVVNAPIGVAVLVLARRLLPADVVPMERGRLDVAGAGLVTLALMVAMYGVVGGNEAGWTSARTLTLLGAAAVLLVGFVGREARCAHPLIPLRLFTLRNVAVSQVVGMLWSAAMFACFFLSALYLQQVLGYDALAVGLAYLPSCVVMAACSLGLSDRIVMRFGIRAPLAVGLGLAGVSLALFSRAPVDGTFVVDVLPAMVLLGIGAGIAFNPVLLAAMGDVEPHEAGLASGVVNTSFMMGGALGLAVLVAVSSARTSALEAAGADPVVALNEGLQGGVPRRRRLRRTGRPGRRPLPPPTADGVSGAGAGLRRGSLTRVRVTLGQGSTPESS